ncbi:MAG: 50S ribosomal protein L31 [Candidatus Thiodiazotropha sp. (ex Rostrolucina anterorostrata)]|nr:50S ribosomal protein L31 [Candidatus Thiodiazotropha sp. (ex Rostrolucina anterorostrata)]
MFHGRMSTTARHLDYDIHHTCHPFFHRENHLFHDRRGRLSRFAEIQHSDDRTRRSSRYEYRSGGIG